MWSHLILVDQPALDFWWTLDSAAMLDAEVCFSFSISAYFVIKTFMTFCSTRISLNFKKTKKIIPPRSETLSTDSLFFLSYQLFVFVSIFLPRKEPRTSRKRWPPWQQCRESPFCWLASLPGWHWQRLVSNFNRCIGTAFVSLSGDWPKKAI